jgi:hypothetical protein
MTIQHDKPVQGMVDFVVEGYGRLDYAISATVCFVHRHMVCNGVILEGEN